MIRGYCNEYAPLRRVMIHLPRAKELSVSSPEEAMFSDSPDPQRVISEVRALIRLLRKLNIEVLTDAGVAYKTSCPNYLFMRDIGVFLPGHVIIANPRHTVRKGERDLFRAFLKKIRYSGAIVEVPENIPFEGADLLMRDRNTVIVSAGNRTGQKFAGWFRARFPQYKVRVIRALKEQVPQHLLGVKMITDENFLISRTFLHPAKLGYHRVLTLMETEEVREKLAMNVLVIAPQTLIMPDDCPGTKSFLESYGLSCHTSPMKEIRKMAGGFACMCLIVEREILS